MFSLAEYAHMVEQFMHNGYKTIFFDRLSQDQNQLILRHDIDFDCQYAYEISLLEDELGVKSTYFFMLRSNSYNLLSDENSEYVYDIQKRGHKVCLHFDPVIYENFNEGFELEQKIFESAFEQKLNIVSIHRPNEFFLNYDESINGVEHTYQNKYFKNIKYISDSGGCWKYGHPFETQEFKDRKTIHLLVHPIWWTTKGNSSTEKLENFVNFRKNKYQKHISKNCKSYKPVCLEGIR